jgi:4'-phosphopantetheinyl transferase
MAGDPPLDSVVGMLALNWEPVDPAGSPPVLGEHGVHLWALDLESAESRLSGYLTGADRARGARILQQDKRRLYLGGRAGMRYLLSAYTGLPVADIGFAYGARGKPVLANTMASAGPRFNYSLSRDKVLYAISPDRELGVDMEALPRRASAESLARRTLTAREREAWASLPASTRNDAMLCSWTRKEAYGKALGVGIRYNLNSVSLFDTPLRPRFSSPRTGLFADTDPTGMPSSLEGLQIRMPFPAVAALMYSSAGPGSELPVVEGRQLAVGGVIPPTTTTTNRETL